MTGQEMVKRYEANGWTLDRINGSHHIMVKAGRRNQPIPCHAGKDLPKGLQHKLLKRMVE